MAMFLTILLASFPVFCVLAYFWHLDKGEKEPFPLMKSVFLAGFAITIPVAFIELGLEYIGLLLPVSPLVFVFLSAVFFVALPEEYAKFWVVKNRAYNSPRFNEIMDGITYCVLASMGFALLENVLYTIQFGIGTGVLRAFTAVPAHALFSGIMGYYMGLAKHAASPEMEKKLLRKGLVCGVLFHGLYDFLLLSAVPALVISIIPLLGGMSIFLHQRIKALGTFQSSDPRQP